jgi:hypothetical protein
LSDARLVALQTEMVDLSLTRLLMPRLYPEIPKIFGRTQPQGTSIPTMATSDNPATHLSVLLNSCRLLDPSVLLELAHGRILGLGLSFAFALVD